MFYRTDATYDIRPETVREILKCDSSPVNRIAKMVPEGAKVLDIGAGNGLLAAVLNAEHRDVTVDGIEPNPYAVEIARYHYRKLYCGYAQDYFSIIGEEAYDYVVLADVIEHMPDPFQFLKDLKSCLPETSKVVLSVPNVAFGAVRIALMCGRFDYVDSGLLEKTHLRFFTHTTLARMIDSLGFHVEKMYLLQQNLFETEIELHKLPFNWFVFRKATTDEFSSVYQFMLVLSQKATCPTENVIYGRKCLFPLFRYLYERLKRH